MKKELNNKGYLNEISRCLQDKKWIFAKTDPDNPHHYTLRKDWEDPWFTFDEIVMFIRDNGIKEKHKNNWHSVLNLDGFEYWVKAYSLNNSHQKIFIPAHKIFLISRKKL